MNYFNKLKSLYSRKWQASFIILFSVTTIFLLCELKNHRFHMHDFHVYYTAASRIVHGENIFRPAEDGFYHFKYSPTSAIFFIPFSFLPYDFAKVMYWLILSVIICAGFYMSLTMLKPDFKQQKDHRHTNNFVLLSALVVSVHFFRELELGQVNHLLLVIYIGILFLFWKNQQKASGAVLAASLFFKPFALLFVPWFFLMKKWKLILFSVISTVVFALLPAVFDGLKALPSQYSSWFQEMFIELSHKQTLLTNENHTIFSILARYTPLRFTSIVTNYAHLYQTVIMLLLCLTFIIMYRKRASINAPFLLEGAFLINLIPLLSFTSHNAFGFVELSVMIILYYFKELSRPLKVTAIAGMILSGGNIYELVGKKLWFVFNNLSLVGIGALLLLAVLFFMRNKKIC